MTRSADNVIIEFVQYGKYVKVTAIDCITGEEVSTMGDARHSQAYLKKIAIQKLRRVQQKR